MVHKPSDCELGKKHKDDQRKDRNKANPAVVASAAAPSTLATQPSWPLLQTLKKNDGLRQHAFGKCC